MAISSLQLAHVLHRGPALRPRLLQGVPGFRDIAPQPGIELTAQERRQFLEWQYAQPRAANDPRPDYTDVQRFGPNVVDWSKYLDEVKPRLTNAPRMMAEGGTLIAGGFPQWILDITDPIEQEKARKAWAESQTPNFTNFAPNPVQIPLAPALAQEQQYAPPPITPATPVVPGTPINQAYIPHPTALGAAPIVGTTPPPQLSGLARLAEHVLPNGPIEDVLLAPSRRREQMVAEGTLPNAGQLIGANAADLAYEKLTGKHLPDTFLSNVARLATNPLVGAGFGSGGLATNAIRTVGGALGAQAGSEADKALDTQIPIVGGPLTLLGGGLGAMSPEIGKALGQGAAAYGRAALGAGAGGVPEGAVAPTQSPVVRLPGTAAQGPVEVSPSARGVRLPADVGGGITPEQRAAALAKSQELADMLNATPESIAKSAKTRQNRLLGQMGEGPGKPKPIKTPTEPLPPPMTLEEATSGIVPPKKPPTTTAGAGQPPIEPPIAPEIVPPGQPVPHSRLNDLGDLLAAPIALKSSLSPPFLRQGMTRFVTAPRAALNELGQSLKASLSEADSLALQEKILNDPMVRSTATLPGDALAGKTWQDVGGTVLQFGKQATLETSPEELVGLRQSWLGRQIQNFWPVKISDRQMATEINLHRTNWYKGVAANMIKAGEENPQAYVDLRKFIEHATQRGDWGQSIPAFFSTRALSGRVQAVMDIAKNIPPGLTGGYMRAGATQETGKVLLGMAAAGGAMVGIPAALGLGTIVRSANGLPILKVGNDRFDPWAGWNPIAKLVMGIGTDIEKRAGEGDYANLPQDAIAVVGKRTLGFLERGLSPAAGTLLAAGTGKDYLGNPYNLADKAKSGALISDLIAPFIVQSIYDAYRLGGLRSVARVSPAASLSLGTNTYGPSPAERRNSLQDEWAKSNYGGRTWRELLPGEQQQAPENVKAAQEAARQASAEKQNPISVITQANQAERQQTFEPRAQAVDTGIASGAISGEKARELFDGLTNDMGVAADARRSDPAYQQAIADLEKNKKDLTPAEQATADYYAIFDTPGLHKPTGEFDFNVYDKALADWQAKYPDIAKSDVSPAKPLSPKHAELIADRQTLAPYFDIQRQEWQKIAAKNPIFASASSPDEWLTQKKQALEQAGQSPYAADLIANALLDAYRAQESTASLIYLVQHRDAISLLNKWGYSVPSSIAALAPDYTQQFQSAGVR